MCRVLKVSRSGYYSWCSRLPSERKKENQILDFHIKVIYKKHKGRPGSPKITEYLHEMGIPVSKNRDARRMNELGLKSIIRKKYRSTTDSKHSLPVAANLLQRNFSTEASNIAWVSDSPYIDAAQGCGYTWQSFWICIPGELWDGNSVNPWEQTWCHQHYSRL